MRLSRDLLVLAILLAVVTGLALTAASVKPSASPESYTAYSTHTVGRLGTLALQMWLDTLGYRTQRIEGAVFSIPGGARALFILGQPQPLTLREVDLLVAWVERGNTLVVAGTSRTVNPLMQAWQQDAHRSFDHAVESAAIEQPLLGDLPQTPAAVNTWQGLALNRNDYVQYLSAENTPLLVSFPRGQGRVWLTSAPYLFTNAALHNEANAALVGAMLSETPRGGLIAFDEYHLGFRQNAQNERNLQTLLSTTPGGWALVYALTVVFGYLLINGRRLGRVVPLPQTLARRRPVEYVTAVAQLLQRAGKQGMVLRHYHRQLKRRLGRTYGVTADLPDDPFVAAVGLRDRRLDQHALATLLGALAGPRTGARRLVQLVSQAIEFTDRRG